MEFFIDVMYVCMCTNICIIIYIVEYRRLVMIPLNMIDCASQEGSQNFLFGVKL